MKTTKTLLVAALAAAGLAATAAQAQNHSHGRGGGGAMSGSHGQWSGRGAASGGHWSGGHGWRGSGWRGGSRWHGGSWGPRVGVYIGAPVLFGSYYWGSPYWGPSYYWDDYPRETVVYRERIIEREPAEEETTTAVPSDAAGAPSRGPAYMNYCDSAKAYYPKVTSCPEGWRFEPAQPSYRPSRPSYPQPRSSAPEPASPSPQ
jgi:hypothetical protein